MVGKKLGKHTLVKQSFWGESRWGRHHQSLVPTTGLFPPEPFGLRVEKCRGRETPTTFPVRGHVHQRTFPTKGPDPLQASEPAGTTVSGNCTTWSRKQLRQAASPMMQIPASTCTCRTSVLCENACGSILPALLDGTRMALTLPCSCPLCSASVKHCRTNKSRKLALASWSCSCFSKLSDGVDAPQKPQIID